MQLTPLALYNYMIYDGQAPEGEATILADVGADKTDLVVADGRLLEAREILSALDAGRSFLRLSPAEAGRLGLPARTALAGLARIDAGAAGPWGIAAVASAERERDRERWAHWRLILSVVTASYSCSTSWPSPISAASVTSGWNARGGPRPWALWPWG